MKYGISLLILLIIGMGIFLNRTDKQSAAKIAALEAAIDSIRLGHNMMLHIDTVQNNRLDQFQQSFYGVDAFANWVIENVEAMQPDTAMTWAGYLEAKRAENEKAAINETKKAE